MNFKFCLIISKSKPFFKGKIHQYFCTGRDLTSTSWYFGRYRSPSNVFHLVLNNQYGPRMTTLKRVTSRPFIRFCFIFSFHMTLSPKQVGNSLNVTKHKNNKLIMTSYNMAQQQKQHHSTLFQVTQPAIGNLGNSFLSVID